MVELIFIGRNSGGVVNSLEVKDVGSYGTNNVSIGITVQHNSAVIYEDAIDTYSISKGGSIVISAPYDDNGIKTGTYYTRFRVRNNDTLEVSEYNSTLTLNYVPYGEDLTIILNGLSSTISCTDGSQYTGSVVTTYELYHLDPNGVRRTTDQRTLLVPATIYSGTHTFGTNVDIVWSETSITLYDRISHTETAIAYNLDKDTLWAQIDSLNDEYQVKLGTDIAGANRLRDKVVRCNVWQDDFNRAIIDGDLLAGYNALVNINSDLNDTSPTIEEIPVFTIPSTEYHIHENKTNVLDLLTNEGGVLYWNGQPVESTGLVRMVALDGLGYLSTKFSNNFEINGSNKVELKTLGSGVTVGGVSKTIIATVDNKGRVTSISDSNIQISQSQVTGLGTLLDSKINNTDYKDIDILNKIKNVDGEDSGLDADYLRGLTLNYQGSSYIPYVNASGYMGVQRFPQYPLDVYGTVRLGDLNGYVKGTNGVLSAVSKVVDTDIQLSDTTNNNVSVLKHGFTPKLPNDSSKVLKGDGSWGTVITSVDQRLNAVIAMVVDDTYDPATTPPSPVTGDRYIVLTTTLHPDFGTINKNLAGDSLALGVNDIVEYYSGEFRIAFDSSAALQTASALVGIDKNGESSHTWGFDIVNGEWVDLGTSTLHNSFSDLNTGIGQFYHLFNDQYDMVEALEVADRVSSTGILKKTAEDVWTMTQVKTELSDWFELAGTSPNQYIRCKYPFGCDYEVQAYTGGSWLPPNIWAGIPIASASVLGAVKIGTGVAVAPDGTISVATGAGMVYPAAGIPVSTGTAWAASIANNSANWNTAYSWGNHAGLYAPISTVSSQWVTSGSNIYYNGGSVGIGTSTIVNDKVLINSNKGSTNNSALRVIYDNGNNLGEVAMLAHRNGVWSNLYLSGAGDSTSYALYVDGAKPSYFVGNVGIGGIPNTNRKLHLIGNFANSYNRIGFDVDSTVCVPKIYFGEEGSYIAYDYNGNERMVINSRYVTSHYSFQIADVEKMHLSSVGLGIGRTPTSYKLEVEGDILAVNSWIRTTWARGWYNETYGGGIYMTDSTYVRVYNGKSFYVPANIVATGEITAYAPSDIRLKRNVIPISNAMETINRMNPVQFNWNGTAVGLNKEKDEQRLNYGLLAQELEQVLPDLIHTIHGSYKSIDYNGLFAIIIKGLQELNQKVEQWA